MVNNTSIIINNLSKKFGDTEVLSDITIKFNKGGIYGLVGRNGSGKTVFMKCISGFILPTQGEIIVFGEKVGKDVDFPNDLGFILETPCFLPRISGFKNLKYLASIRRKISDNHINECIKLVGLNPKDRKHVGKYSLGMRQRLGIAQAIMEDPKLILLDEPMNGLDNQGVEDMRYLFLKLKNEGKTIILASHNREDIQVLCDEAYELDGGKMKSIS